MTADRLAEQQAKAPVTDRPPECWRCGRALAEFATRPWSIRCKRCGASNRSPDCTNRRDVVD